MLITVRMKTMLLASAGATTTAIGMIGRILLPLLFMPLATGTTGQYSTLTDQVGSPITDITINGGFNGGGSTTVLGAGGGGASDVRTESNSTAGTLSSLA